MKCMTEKNAAMKFIKIAVMQASSASSVLDTL